MKKTLCDWFFVSAAGILLVAAAAKFASAAGSAKILDVKDPVLRVNNRLVMIGVGIVEVSVAGWLLRGRRRSPDTRLALPVMWLAANFVGYRVAVDLAGVKMCPCLGTLGAALPLEKETVEHLLSGVVLYLLFGSALVLWFGHAFESTSGLSEAPPEVLAGVAGTELPSETERACMPSHDRAVPVPK